MKAHRSLEWGLAGTVAALCSLSWFPSAQVLAQESAAPAHGDDLQAGHLHGEIVRSNTDALVFGLNYLLAWQVRLTTEYRKAFNGLEDKLIVGLQFAF